VQTAAGTQPDSPNLRAVVEDVIRNMFMQAMTSGQTGAMPGIGAIMQNVFRTPGQIY